MLEITPIDIGGGGDSQIIFLITGIGRRILGAAERVAISRCRCGVAFVVECGVRSACDAEILFNSAGALQQSLRAKDFPPACWKR